MKLRPVCLLMIVFLSGALLACDEENPAESVPASPAREGVEEGGKADDGGSGEPKLSVLLADHADPVADFLRSRASEDGFVLGDYRGILDGVGDAMGCAPDSQRTFVILLTRANYFPRNIFTLCSDDPNEASRFFMTTQSDRGELEDVDPRDLKLAAWDRVARVYRTYEMKGVEGKEGMRVEVSPAKCRQCHTGPADMDNGLVPFAPLMNELVNPWTLWNAEPEFRSHLFDEVIDARFETAPVYQEMTKEGRLDSASNFEKHIRAAADRVTTARARGRRNEANLAQSMALLRPLFCDETLNYVSENHATGETRGDVAIDDSIRRLFLKIRADNWPWDWLNDGKLRLPLPKEEEEPLAVMPVRGETTVQMDATLVGRKILTPYQVLRVRALDWKRPVFSEFRCGLFLDAEARLSLQPPDISGYRRNSDLMPVLFEEIMTWNVQDPESGELLVVPLQPQDDVSLVVVADVDSAQGRGALLGDLEQHAVSVDEFGEVLEEYFQGLQKDGGRERLEDMRQKRGCEASARYSAAPRIPGVGSCD